MTSLGFQITGQVLQGIGLGFFISAQVNTAWFVTRIGEFGLYQWCGASDCDYLSWNPNGFLASFTTRIMLIVAAALISAALLSNIMVMFVPCERKRTCYKVAGRLDIAGGILIIAAMIAYTAIILSSETADNFDDWYLGWAYSLCWSSGFLYIIGGVFLILAWSHPPAPGVVQPARAAQIQCNTITTKYQTTVASQPNGGYNNPAAYSAPPALPSYESSVQNDYKLL